MGGYGLRLKKVVRGDNVMKNDNFSNSVTAVSGTAGTGLGLVSVLLIVFIVLKLTGVINWSWWVVILLPFGIELGLVLLFAGVVVIASILIAILRGR